MLFKYLTAQPPYIPPSNPVAGPPGPAIYAGIGSTLYTTTQTVIGTQQAQRYYKFYDLNPTTGQFLSNTPSYTYDFIPSGQPNNTGNYNPTMAPTPSPNGRKAIGCALRSGQAASAANGYTSWYGGTLSHFFYRTSDTGGVSSYSSVSGDTSRTITRYVAWCGDNVKFAMFGGINANLVGLNLVASDTGFQYGTFSDAGALSKSAPISQGFTNAIWLGDDLIVNAGGPLKVYKYPSATPTAATGAPAGNGTGTFVKLSETRFLYMTAMESEPAIRDFTYNSATTTFTEQAVTGAPFGGGSAQLFQFAFPLDADRFQYYAFLNNAPARQLRFGKSGSGAFSKITNDFAFSYLSPSDLGHPSTNTVITTNISVYNLPN